METDNVCLINYRNRVSWGLLPCTEYSSLVPETHRGEERYID